MANSKIVDVKGIGSAKGEKLIASGIKDIDTLPATCKTSTERKEFAQKSGISEREILRFANMVNLFRISDVDQSSPICWKPLGYTVPELARRNATNLANAMSDASDVNEKKKLTRRVPSETKVAKWVEKAKSLPRMLEY